MKYLTDEQKKQAFELAVAAQNIAEGVDGMSVEYAFEVLVNGMMSQQVSVIKEVNDLEKWKPLINGSDDETQA